MCFHCVLSCLSIMKNKRFFILIISYLCEIIDSLLIFCTLKTNLSITVKLLIDRPQSKDIKPRQCTTAFSYCFLVICLYLYLCSDSIHIQISANERTDGKKLASYQPWNTTHMHTSASTQSYASFTMAEIGKFLNVANDFIQRADS